MYVTYPHMGQIHTRGRGGRRGEERQKQRQKKRGREGASEWEYIHTNYKANEVKREQQVNLVKGIQMFFILLLFL